MKGVKENGKIKFSRELTEKEKATVDFEQAGNVTRKIDAIAEYLGLKK